MIGLGEGIIRDELLKKNPALDLGGVDSQLLIICHRDFMNYINWLSLPDNKGLRDESLVIYIRQRLMMVPIMLPRVLRSRIMMFAIQIDDEKEKELESMMREWVDKWWKKYTERTTIELKIPKHAIKMTKKGQKTWVSKFSDEEREDIFGYLMILFIKGGEYAFTAEIANGLIVAYLARPKYSNAKTITKEEKLNLLQALGSEVKHIIKSKKTKLIFIQPDFKTFMNEWRNDDTSNIV